jgi:hypothetical protein
VFALIAVFMLVTVWFLLGPILGTLASALVSAGSSVITDPTFSGNLIPFSNNIVTLVAYAFAAIGVGLGAYIIMLSLREEVTSQ